MPPRIAATFTGDPTTAYLEGVPAHDLTQDEIDALPDDRRAHLLANAASANPIYTLHGRDIKAEAKEAAAGEAEASSAPVDVQPSPLPRSASVVAAPPSTRSASDTEKS